jgi:hypothetical protein
MALHADNDGYMRLAKMEPGCVTPILLVQDESEVK